MIVASKAKEVIAACEMQMSGDFADAFSAKATELLNSAIARAKANDRKTVRPCDL